MTPDFNMIHKVGRNINSRDLEVPLAPFNSVSADALSRLILYLNPALFPRLSKRPKGPKESSRPPALLEEDRMLALCLMHVGKNFEVRSLCVIVHVGMCVCGLEV